MNSVSNENKNKDYLRIADGSKDDVGRGILRIDPKIARMLKLGTGDVIEVYNEYKDKRTAGLLYPSRPEDAGSGVIRLDSSLRRNLGASIDDWVTIRKIQAKLADSITFAAIGRPVVVRESRALAGLLDNRVVTKEDIISFYAMGQRYDFIILKYSPPAEAVRIHINTRIIVAEKPIEELETLGKLKVTYEDIGGLHEEIRKIREMIELPMRHP
jgi:transitional endoplasmic reticulum ATPase